MLYVMRSKFDSIINCVFQIAPAVGRTRNKGIIGETIITRWVPLVTRMNELNDGSNKCGPSSIPE